MWSIAVKPMRDIACVGLLLFSAGGAFATPAEPETKVVARLYKAFAWQAFTAQPDLFGEGLPGERREGLEKYFAPDLARSLADDFACQARTRGVCKLDFDLLFDSQDPRVSDLDLERVSAGVVRVRFKDPVTEATTRIEFKLAVVGGKWRIRDVAYATANRSSLKAVLSRELP